LDVGCGTGTLLVQLVAQAPKAIELVGVDPAAGMVAQSRSALRDAPRARIKQASVERLPFADDSFDLVVSVLSFDHWSDQQAGLFECARVARHGARLVIVDLFARWLRATTLLSQRERARTVKQATDLLRRAGFPQLNWQRVYALGPLPLVQAAVARL
jgi:ubiquinone/menaquinone biosynthesis C-methylase UbiE